MQYLFILNDPAYGTERCYNGIRLAHSLQKRENVQVKVFLMADAVTCAKSGQKTPDGYYNLQRMLKGLTTRGVAIGACGTCMDARGFTDAELMEGVHRSTMDELTDWTLEADSVIVF